MIYAGLAPDAPLNVVTVQSGTYVRVDWDEPPDNGIEIRAYDIQILKSDAVTYSNATTLCSTDADTVLANTECLILYTDLESATFSLTLGTSI
mmetsp:Transcript_9439/g.8968  ORF Transcript_9439/g.8968 Transcript_9439/m.8968 type:complete len:93 (+) Transcript_9439:6064-6342(+)